MHRILTTSPLIGSYSCFMLLAIVAGFLLARRNARRMGLEARHIDNVVLLAAIAGLFGARLFSWLFYFPPGIGWWRAMTERGGGMVFYGGVILGMAAVIAYACWSKIAFGRLADVLAGPLALGLAIGRIGCFMAGCCWGDLCVDAATGSSLPDARSQYQVHTVPLLSGKNFPLAVRFPIDCGALEQQQQLRLVPADATESLPVHPVQLYETALALGLMVWLQRRLRRSNGSGEVLAAFGVGYGVIRFLLEFLRADNPPDYFGLTLSQVISLAALVVCWAFFVSRRREPELERVVQKSFEFRPPTFEFRLGGREHLSRHHTKPDDHAAFRFSERSRQMR